MPLKTYSKATGYVSPYKSQGYYQPIQTAGQPVSFDYFDYSAQDRVTMWSLLAKLYLGLKAVVASSTIAGLIIPAGFIIAGLGFIYLQFQPSIVEEVKAYSGFYDQGTVSLVESNYIIDRLQYVSNPGADYFLSVAKIALDSQYYQPDTYSLNYRGTMYLTIPSLGFNRLPITANVESSTKEIYDRVLNNSLAHFQGTGLPASDQNNNIVIYGHSAGGAYNPRPDDVLAAFTFLSDLKVGDIIILEMDGVEYKYRMSRSSIVEPTDTSVISGTPGRETLTLFTCHPPGNNTSRLVVTALPIT